MTKFVLVSLILSGFAMAGEPVLVKEIQQTANMMPVIPPGGHPIRSTLEVDVLSGGCTRASDFKLVVKHTLLGQTLDIVRIQPDVCEMVPHRKTVTLETELLSLSSKRPITILNPLFAEEQVVH